MFERKNWVMGGRLKELPENLGLEGGGWLGICRGKEGWGGQRGLGVIIGSRPREFLEPRR